MSGILDVSAEQYHADRVADVPTLSRSIATILCQQSPLHAWTAHPKLNPNFAPDDDDKFDIGTGVHDLFLVGADRIQIINADNYRTKAAQEEKYKARVEGKIPLLAHQAGDVYQLHEALKRQIGEHTAEPALFSDGKPEQTITWDENGVTCRARLDWLRDDHTAIDDLKTTSRMGGANPESFARNLYTTGYDIQAAFYTRAVEAATGVTPVFRFTVIETEPPYAMSVVQLGSAAITLARKKVDYAVSLWRHCLDTGVWPSYPTRTAFADLPAWEETRWLEKEEREMVA